MATVTQPPIISELSISEGEFTSFPFEAPVVAGLKYELDWFVFGKTADVNDDYFVLPASGSNWITLSPGSKFDITIRANEDGIKEAAETLTLEANIRITGFGNVVIQPLFSTITILPSDGATEIDDDSGLPADSGFSLRNLVENIPGVRSVYETGRFAYDSIRQSWTAYTDRSGISGGSLDASVGRAGSGKDSLYVFLGAQVQKTLINYSLDDSSLSLIQKSSLKAYANSIAGISFGINTETWATSSLREIGNALDNVIPDDPSLEFERVDFNINAFEQNLKNYFKAVVDEQIGVPLNATLAKVEAARISFSRSDLSARLEFDDPDDGVASLNTAIDHHAGVMGSAGADILTTGDLIDLVYGGAGNDIIRGNGGADILIGGDGADTIFGGRGQDSISGGAGNDTIDGGEDRDFAFFTGARSNYTITSSGTMEITVVDRRTGDRDSLINIERLVFEDSIVAFDTTAPAGPSGVAGVAYRVYQAAFDRKPDIGGLTFWTKWLDDGRTDVIGIAAQFIGSSEFAALYGSNTPNNADFMTSIYQNVLNRAPDNTGYTFWLDRLSDNTFSKADVLARFSDSPENRLNVQAETTNGIILEARYFDY